MYDLSQKSPVEIIMVITAFFFLILALLQLYSELCYRRALKGSIKNVLCLFVGVGGCV